MDVDLQAILESSLEQFGSDAFSVLIVILPIGFTVLVSVLLVAKAIALFTGFGQMGGRKPNKAAVDLAAKYAEFETNSHRYAKVNTYAPDPFLNQKKVNPVDTQIGAAPTVGKPFNVAELQRQGYIQSGQPMLWSFEQYLNMGDKKRAGLVLGAMRQRPQYAPYISSLSKFL